MREWRRGKSSSLSYIFQTLFFDNLIVQSCVVEEGYGTKMSTFASKADPSAKRPSDSFFLKDRGVCLPAVGAGDNRTPREHQENRTEHHPSLHPPLTECLLPQQLRAAPCCRKPGWTPSPGAPVYLERETVKLRGKRRGQLHSKAKSGCLTTIPAVGGLDFSWKFGLLMSPMVNNPSSASRTLLHEID